MISSVKSAAARYYTTSPYSLESLINRDSRNIYEFYRNVIIPLSFFGLGSVDSLLNMKMWELHEFNYLTKDSETQELYNNLHGLASK